MSTGATGYATESARASLAYGFDELGLERIVAVALESTSPPGECSRSAG